MLNGISPLISPDLLRTLCEMGHGDQILLADAHFPGYTMHPRVLRADGLPIAALLDAILPLFALDTGSNPLGMMQPDHDSELDAAVEKDYMDAVRRHARNAPAPARLDRHTFYTLARASFAVLMTGELRPYGNILLKKGITVTHYDSTRS